MRETRRDGGRAVVALVLSAATHLSLTLIGDPPAAGEPDAAQAQGVRVVDVEVELPAARAVGESVWARDQVLPGGATRARPDDGRAGRGGDSEVGAPAVNLAARDDQAHLAPELPSHFNRAQEARTRSGEERRSPEDDRVSPRPMILTFVADGDALRFTPAVRAREQSRREEAAGPGVAGGWMSGGAAPKAMKGSAGALGREAPTARPMTVRGDESSPADERGSYEDSTDAEQEVVTLSPSPLRASTAGGREGQGRGGTEGGGAPGAGGVLGTGSRTQPLGGGGGGFGVDPADLRRRMYLRSMWARIQNSWSADDFPKQAALEGKQGHTIVSFTVMPDGHVTNVRIARPSGFPDFDRKMVRALMRAAPFGRLPIELGPVLHRTHDFVVSNPAVRPPHR